MSKKIKKGDIVRLKPGSPKMVVESCGGEQVLLCFYRQGSGYNSIQVDTDCIRKCWFGFL